MLLMIMKFGYSLRKLETNVITLLSRPNNYFTTNIAASKKDPSKTWKLINELSSRKVSEVTSVKKINLDGNDITNSADISDAFNSYFTSIGETLANKIPNSNVDPVSYILPTNTIFSFKEIGMCTVNSLLKYNN